VVTLIVIYGFLSMAWVACITVPVFLLLAGFSITNALLEYRLGDLLFSAPPGESLSLATGTTIVAGGFIIGGVHVPDMTRFNGSAADVIKQTAVGITLGEYTVGLIGVLLALALKTQNTIEIVTSTSGFIGTIILVAATLKINHWNLYSSSLGFANSIDAIFRKRMNRAVITSLVGALGTVLSALGILEQFIPSLIALGVVIPPIAGIIIVDYYLLRRHREQLKESAALPFGTRKRGIRSSHCRTMRSGSITILGGRSSGVACSSFSRMRRSSKSASPSPMPNTLRYSLSSLMPSAWVEEST
jgi:cytosine permease